MQGGAFGAAEVEIPFGAAGDAMRAHLVAEVQEFVWEAAANSDYEIPTDRIAVTLL